MEYIVVSVSSMRKSERYLSGNVISDSASILNYTQVLSGMDGVRFMRDPTLDGLATVCHEISRATKMGIRLQ